MIKILLAAATVALLCYLGHQVDAWQNKKRRARWLRQLHNETSEPQEAERRRGPG